MKEPTQKERIAKIETDISWIVKMMSNHLRHHWAMNMALLAAALSAITSLVLVLIRQ